MPWQEVNGLRLYYRHDGAGPDVVFVHGVAGNCAVWYLCGLVTRLISRFRVTCYDLRGHGQSDSTPNGYTSRDMAADLHALLIARGIGQPIVVGHSFGAAVALQYALAQPNRVAGVVVSDAYLPGLAHLQKTPGLWPGWHSYKKRAAALGLEISEDWLDLDSLFQQAAALTAEERAEFAAIAGEGTLDRLLRMASTSCGRDVSAVAGLTAERLAQIQAPVVCLYGEHSPFLATCDYLTQALPRCRRRLLPEAEHFGFEENPQQFCELLCDELCRLAGLPALPDSTAGHAARRTDTLMSREPQA
jgi:2-hydroxy-6-oxonona-2,4-dienedioate hydrolase/2-succinyl-6-hydroxy-2,4-cyclohexadiene-1-carboxylate synthase